MGRIKTSFIKHVGQELYQKHSEEFSTDFSKNKEVVNSLVTTESKKLRNIIAGYITNLKRQHS
jgi:small subunit ribosomal protein S17e